MRQGKRNQNGMNQTDLPGILFRTAFVLYISATYLQTTMYTQFAVLAVIFVYMRYTALAILLLLIALNAAEDLGADRLFHRSERGGIGRMEEPRRRAGIGRADGSRRRAGGSRADAGRRSDEPRREAGNDRPNAGRRRRRRTSMEYHMAWTEKLWYHKYTFLLAAAGASAAVSSLVSGDRTPLYATAFLFAARRRYLKQTFRAAFGVQMGLLVFVIVSSTADLIPDLLIKRDIIPIRHSLGFTYPSVCAAYFYFLLILYLWMYGREISWRDLLWIEVVNWLIYILTDARMSFLLITLLLACAYVCCCRGADRRIKEWLEEQKKRGSALCRVGTVLYDYYPVFLSGMFLLWCLIDLAAGGNSILDRALSGRLKYTVSVVKEYGVHLFGKAIPWVGFGGTENTDALLKSYNFVDCSYAYILLSYGIVFFALVMVYLVFLQKYMRRREGVWRCLLLLFIWSYCLLEPRLLELQANCLLLLGVPLLGSGRKREGAVRYG